VRSFDHWDIYYLYEYAYSFLLHGDGEIYLLSFENGKDRFCYVVMQKDIADAAQFSGHLERDAYYDWETPYGYGGPLTDAAISADSKRLFEREISEYCRENGIVSQFVRFHPLLRNYEVMPEVIESRYLKDTIYIDTSDRDLIVKNMDTKNRNMVRKARKNGVVIVRKEIEDFEDFIRMYQETMKKNGAEDYYTFERTYFESLAAMKENACILYAMYEGQPISGSILYFNDRFMHYHLSGSHTEFRKYSPGNLLLYEAACLANEKGITRFHLGGGMEAEDSLFGFKKQFNKNGRAKFVVGRTIFDRRKYDDLKKVRKKLDSGFEEDNGFMIQYRK